MIFRREVLERDEPVEFPRLLQTIRYLTGYSSSALAFVLNVPRSTLNSWERKGCCPNYEDGRAIMKLFESCRNSDTRDAEIAA